MAVRIVIADDHPVVCAGIQSLLARQTDIEPVGEARDGDEAVQQVEALQPDVLLLDLSMPGLPANDVALRAAEWYGGYFEAARIFLAKHGYMRQTLSKSQLNQR